MVVLVVGGAGYIGSQTARVLARRGHEVIVYDNLSTGDIALANGFPLVVGEASDSKKLTPLLRRVDAVMHFAACAYVGESAVHPRKYFVNNVHAGLALLHAVLDSPVRKFIFSSSCAVYGEPEKLPITEQTPRLPMNPYGATKLAIENALDAYDRAYGLRFVSFRYFNAAGADEAGAVGEMHSPETHLIPCAFEAIDGRRDALEIYGRDYRTSDGTCIRDYVDVNDLAEAHALGLEYLEQGAVSAELNLGTGKGSSVREVLKTIENVTGCLVPTRFAPRRPGDPPELVADPTRAQHILGWRAQRSLEQTIASAWRWHRAKSKPRIEEQMSSSLEQVPA